MVYTYVDDKFVQYMFRIYNQNITNGNIEFNLHLITNIVPPPSHSGQLSIIINIKNVPLPLFIFL